MGTLSRKQNRKGAKQTRRIPLNGLTAIAVFALFAIGVSFAYTAETGQFSPASQGSYNGMMGGAHISDQNFTAECNQMMSGYGLNNTTIESMDNLMSGSSMNQIMSQMMSGSTMPNGMMSSGK